MNKFCVMLGYFSIFVLIVSGTVSEENKTYVNETVIDNENQTAKVEDQKITKNAGLVDLKPKTLPASNITLKSNGNNTDQKNSVSSQLTEVQLDENGKSHNWKDFQNGTFSTTIVNKANKTMKIKIRKVKLDRNLVNQNSLQENPATNHNKSNNYTDQEPAESTVHNKISSIPQNRKSLYIESDKRFVDWKEIGTNALRDAVIKTLTIRSQNLSPGNGNVQKNSSTTPNIRPSQPENRLEKPAINFKSTQSFNNRNYSSPSPKINSGVNKNAQQNSSTTSNITPSQLENRLERPTIFSIGFNNTENFNDWRGMDTFSDASEIQGEKVDRFHFSQSFVDERNATTSTLAPLPSNGTLLVENRTTGISEEFEKSSPNETNFQLDTVNSSGWVGMDFRTKVNKEEALENVNLQNSSNLSIQENLNETLDSRNNKISEMVERLNKINIEYFNVHRNLIKNRNKNFNQIPFDDGSDWKAIVGVVPITTNKTSTIRNQTINLSNNNNIIYGRPKYKNKQLSANSTVELTTKGRYADYQQSGSVDNYQLQPFGENFEENNLDAFTNVANQEPHLEEVQISKPSINDELENANFENPATEKFNSGGNWNFEEEWKAIDGNNPKHHHVTTKTEIKIENRVPFPYPIEKNVLYPVEKHVPYPVNIEVPSPYPVIKEVHVPQKVSVNVPVPMYKPFPVEKVVKYPVQVPVDQPYPVQVKVPHYYPVEVQIPFPVKVKVPQPIPIIKKVPYEVKHFYHVPKPYPVHKNVYYPVKVHYERLVRYNVYKPVPYKVYKNVYVPYYVEKPYPVKVYEDKEVHDPPVEEKPQFFDHPIENTQPFRYKEQPDSIPVYEQDIEKTPSEFESNDWKVNFDPFGEVSPGKLL